MNSIFLGGFFWLITGILFVIGHSTQNHEITNAAWAVFGVSCAVTVGLIIAQFVNSGELKENLAEVKVCQRQIKYSQEKHDELKKFYEKQVLEVYPNFEKNLLESLGPGKNADLVALFQQYPELQSSKLLRQMVDKITNLVDRIYSDKNSLERTFKQIRIYQTNSWIIFKFPIPEEILKEL